MGRHTRRTVYLLGELKDIQLENTRVSVPLLPVFFFSMPSKEMIIAIDFVSFGINMLYFIVTDLDHGK